VRQGKRVAVGKKQGAVPTAQSSGKIEVRLDAFPWFDLKRFAAIDAAESAAVMGATGGYLEDEGKGLAGGPDDVS
jgi:hypothetical protein